jgi:ABC-type multidrug transport system ATPase subunit
MNENTKNWITVSSLFYSKIVSRRHKIPILRGLNLKIRRGTIHCIVGPNGSGKTTLIKMLLGIIEPDNGRIRIFGMNPGKFRLKRKLGYLPERFHPFPDMRLWAVMKFYASLSNLRCRGWKEQLINLMEEFHLHQLLDRRLCQLSAGELRRFGIVQSIIGEPELLLLDEPTSGLDVCGVERLRDALRRMRASGRTVIMNSHNFDVIEDISDEITIISRGEIIMQGKMNKEDIRHILKGLGIGSYTNKDA